MKAQRSSKAEKAKSCNKMYATGITVEIGVGAIGVLLVVLGTLVGINWESQIDSRFQKEMVLTPTSRGFPEWFNPSINLSSNIYFWNWTNPETIGTPDYKPSFIEVGPYSFREVHHKANMTWNENGTVSFRWQKHYYFQPDFSNGSLDDVITSVNTVLATVSSQTIGLRGFSKTFLSMTMAGLRQGISWNRTVRELTFEGFDNPIIKFAKYLPGSDSTPDKFGYFYDRNGTIPSDYYNMGSGALDIYELGTAKAFDYKNFSTAFEGVCSEIVGSFGELLPPHRTRDTPLVLYTPNMCRPISYYYVEESEHNDIPVLVYASTEKSADNGTLVPENKCFCPTTGCEPSGMFNLTSCRNAPVIMSFPHMYLADPIYRDAVDGMNPDREKHQFYVKVEPLTGIIMEVRARLQLNVHLKGNKGLRLFHNVKDVVLPVFWIETVASLPESHSGGVKFLLQIISLGPYITSLVVTLGAIILVIIIARQQCRKTCCKRHRNKMEVKQIIGGEISKSALCPLVDKEMTSLQVTRTVELSNDETSTAMPLSLLTQKDTTSQDFR